MALYRLEDEFSNGDLELALLQYLFEHPEELPRHTTTLRADLFAVQPDLWNEVQAALLTGTSVTVPAAAIPISDLPSALLELNRLHRMRLLARMQEKTA